jgi:CheY-like chemotaxis protein
MMTVLIVEDNAEMRRLLKSFVGPLAETAYECGDGAEAEARYAELQPDWVLMDIEMPRVDGIAATRRIKAAFPAARILIVTNYGDVALRATALAAGACGYVSKENLPELRRLLSAAPAANPLDRE